MHAVSVPAVSVTVMVAVVVIHGLVDAAVATVVIQDVATAAPFLSTEAVATHAGIDI